MTSQVEAQVKPHNVKEVVALLAEQFPLCFSLTGPAKPLKVGIFQDLAEKLQENPLISKTMLRQALRVYTSSWRYLEAVKEGAFRVDLSGVDGAVIDASQAEHAAATLAESKAKAQEARKARQQAERAKAKAAAVAAGDAAKPADAAKAAKPAYKKPEHKPSNRAAKAATLKSKPAAEPLKAAPVELKAVEDGQLVVGGKVLVKFGASPIAATVVELAKQDVVVQLASGMIVKTQRGSLFQA
ncbi:RNA chaperone ProQ [Rheinheimera texasensis]|jgi:ProP effector|uniref:RNA chaperone ProQ n=1 Tax=Rheinheimera texasensis TaxID=306205 RepID=UPI0004E28D5D|nr:RNA chaperone ProQ [Rheinheimera texasensis]